MYLTLCVLVGSQGEDLLVDLGKYKKVECRWVPCQRNGGSHWCWEQEEKVGVEMVTRDEVWRGMTHAGCRMR